MNIWAIRCDPNVWKNPLDFTSERFQWENAKIDPRGNDFELIPFLIGLGGESC